MLIAGKEKKIESMRKHLETMWKYVELLFLENNYHTFLARRLDFETSEIVRALKYAIALHDLGKLFFQEELRSKGIAPFHEVYSFASISLKSMNIDEALGKSVLTAILLHHHAMRSILEIIDRKYDCKMALKEYIEEFKDIVENMFNIEVPFREEIVSEGKVCIRNDEIRQLVHQNYLRNYVSSLLILYPLAVTDNIAAYTNRACEEAEEICVQKTRAAFARIAYRVEVESKHVSKEFRMKVLGL